MNPKTLKPPENLLSQKPRNPTFINLQRSILKLPKSPKPVNPEREVCITTLLPTAHLLYQSARFRYISIGGLLQLCDWVAIFWQYMPCYKFLTKPPTCTPMKIPNTNHGAVFLYLLPNVEKSLWPTSPIGWRVTGGRDTIVGQHSRDTAGRPGKADPSGVSECPKSDTHKSWSLITSMTANLGPLPLPLNNN
jgi:hypothetical protein